MTTRHRTPVDVLVLLVRDGQVLLTLRAGGIYLSGHWAVPGGHVDAGESVTDAAIREVEEEVGVRLEHGVRFVGVTHHLPPHGDARVGFGFVATEWSGQVSNREPDKCAEVRWFPVDDLPASTMPYTAEIVRLYRCGSPFSLHGWSAVPEEGQDVERAQLAPVDSAGEGT
jgi:mutator protein MutT